MKFKFEVLYRKRDGVQSREQIEKIDLKLCGGDYAARIVLDRLINVFADEKGHINYKARWESFGDKPGLPYNASRYCEWHSPLNLSRKELYRAMFRLREFGLVELYRSEDIWLDGTTEKINYVCLLKDSYVREYLKKSTMTEITDKDRRTFFPNFGFVYLLECGGFYKIGKAKGLDNRISQLEILVPFPTNLVCAIETRDRHEEEKFWHDYYQSYRIKGEWFRLSDKDVSYFRALSESKDYG